MRVRPKLVNLGLPDLNSGQNFRRVHDLTPFITSHKVQQLISDMQTFKWKIPTWDIKDI